MALGQLGKERTLPYHPVSRDRRYIIDVEECGMNGRRHVVRFCGEFISSHLSFSAAVVRAVGDHAARNGALVVTEQRA